MSDDGEPQLPGTIPNPPSAKGRARREDVFGDGRIDCSDFDGDFKRGCHAAQAFGVLAVVPQMLASFLFCCNKALKIGAYMNHLAAVCYIVVVIIIAAVYKDEADDYFNDVFTAMASSAVKLDTGFGWVSGAPLPPPSLFHLAAAVLLPHHRRCVPLARHRLVWNPRCKRQIQFERRLERRVLDERRWHRNRDGEPGLVQLSRAPLTTLLLSAGVEAHRNGWLHLNSRLTAARAPLSV